MKLTQALSTTLIKSILAISTVIGGWTGTPSTVPRTASSVCNFIWCISFVTCILLYSSSIAYCWKEVEKNCKCQTSFDAIVYNGANGAMNSLIRTWSEENRYFKSLHTPICCIDIKHLFLFLLHCKQVRSCNLQYLYSTLLMLTQPLCTKSNFSLDVSWHQTIRTPIVLIYTWSYYEICIQFWTIQVNTMYYDVFSLLFRTYKNPSWKFCREQLAYSFKKNFA